jgi:hypothetical protein
MDKWTPANGALVNEFGERKSSYSGAQQGNCVVVQVVDTRPS